MTPEENKRRAEDSHVRYLKEHLCDKDSEKPFVFISYKSDDWEIVLHDIVYRLVRDYGLNIYFDGSFDIHAPLWIEQFPENMEHYNCMGVLSFVDDKYATSYATLLELMYSQTKAAGDKSVVPINIGDLTKKSGKEGALNTGLGVKYYEDGKENIHAKSEEELFVETFEQMVERGILKDAKFLFKKGKTLTKKICSETVSEMLAYIKKNDNSYRVPGGSLDAIVGSIRDAMDNDVFGDPDPEPKPKPKPDPEPEPKPKPDPEPDPKPDPKPPRKGYLYTFVCDGNRFERKKLKEMMLIVFKYVLNRNPGKADELIENIPCLGEGSRIEKNAIPTVFRAGEVVEINGRQISIGTSLNETSVLNYINKLIQFSGEKPEIFAIEEKVPKGNGTGISVNIPISNVPLRAGGVTGPVSLGGNKGKKASADTYSFELYGTRYEGKKLKELMLIVFKQVMPKHADKLDELISLLYCLSEGSRIEKNATPAVFRAGEVVEINGRQISIGTSLGREAVIGYIGKLMATCGEDKETLKIYNYEY